MTQDAPISVRQENDKTVVSIDTNNVDFRNAELLKGALKQQVEKGAKSLILNLANVTFMDSSGLSVLLTGKRVTEEAGGTFSICGLQGYVNNLITLTNLNKTIPVFQDEAEAVRA